MNSLYNCIYCLYNTVKIFLALPKLKKAASFLNLGFAASAEIQAQLQEQLSQQCQQAMQQMQSQQKQLEDQFAQQTRQQIHQQQHMMEILSKQQDAAVHRQVCRITNKYTW